MSPAHLLVGVAGGVSFAPKRNLPDFPPAVAQRIWRLGKHDCARVSDLNISRNSPNSFNTSWIFASILVIMAEVAESSVRFIAIASLLWQKGNFFTRWLWTIRRLSVYLNYRQFGYAPHSICLDIPVPKLNPSPPLPQASMQNLSSSTNLFQQCDRVVPEYVADVFLGQAHQLGRPGHSPQLFIDHEGRLDRVTGVPPVEPRPAN